MKKQVKKKDQNTPETAAAPEENHDTDVFYAFGPLSEEGKTFASTSVNLARIGLNQVAYIRRAVIDNVPVWSIHAATGDAIGAAQTFDQAWGAIKQNNLEPLHVH